MHNLVIADDHPLFREAIKTVALEIFPDANIFETHDLQSTLNEISQEPNIDLILLDLNMPDMDAFNGLIKIRNSHPEIPVVIVSAEEDKSVVLQSITYGAIGFITKSTESKKIGDALKNILEGKVYLPPDIIRSSNKKNTINNTTIPEQSRPIDLKLVASLTRRQLLVLEHIAKGESNKEIAYNLHIAETTVKAHVSAILNKLKVHNRIQAALQSSQLNFDKLLNRIE